MSDIMTDPTPIAAQAAVRHPSWCDPRHCSATAGADADLLVTHRAVVLDDDSVLVEVVSGDIVCARGGELLAADRAVVRVDVPGPHDVGGELDPGQARRLATALITAAVLADDVLPSRCCVSSH